MNKNGLKKFDLAYLYEQGVPEQRNLHILNLYDMDKTDIRLCGSAEEGILVEEDLELVLVNSDIDLLIGNKNISVLMQNDNIFTVNNLYNNAGCENEEQHLDFNSLKMLTDVAE